MNVFSDFYEQARDGDIDGFMSGVSGWLDHLCREPNPISIQELEGNVEFLKVRELTHEDPYTYRGFSKPRGYAGDAVLLDYIYGTTPVPDGTTDTGARILGWGQQNSVAFRAVRERKATLASHMSRTKALSHKSECLSVACGHLRELALLDDGVPNNLSVVALDQDRLSLAVVKATYGKAVVPMHVHIGSLITGQTRLDRKFELITVAGLYDYLDSAAAERLTTTLARQLHLGGDLIISNFIDCWERGYMQYLMKWSLLYRSLEEVQQFAAGLSPDFLVQCSSDETGTIAYLHIHRQ